MTKTIGNTQKAGATGGKPQVKASAPDKSAKKDVKADSRPSKGAKK